MSQIKLYNLNSLCIIKMSEYYEHLEKVSRFMKEYQSLVDCHLVDFITDNLWEKCLPVQLRLQLEEIGPGRILKNIWAENQLSFELESFMKISELLTLENFDHVFCTSDVPKLLCDHGVDVSQPIEKTDGKRLDFMNNKKSHEVEILASIVAKLAKLNSSLVVDAGAGKGYLSTHISEKYGLPVLAVDCSSINHKGAIQRQEIMNKRQSRSLDLVRHSIECIDDSTDFIKLAKSQFPNWSGNLMVTGLHTCGPLGHSTIKSFLKTDCIKSLCVVACCYHLADGSLSGKISFSKNARMLAQQSIDRMSRKTEPLSPSLHYRAVLQILLCSLGIPNARIGRGAPLDNFPTYAKWALDKIGLNSNKIPTENDLDELYHAHECFKSKMDLFQLLRVHVGSVVEAGILLDRVVYLEESKKCSKIALVRLFDPVVSPRCYAIIALK